MRMGAFLPDGDVYVKFDTIVLAPERFGCGESVRPIELTATNDRGNSVRSLTLSVARDC